MIKTIKTLAATSVLLSGGLAAQTTLITNVHGYSLDQGKLVEFTAIRLSDDHIDKIYQKGEGLPEDSKIIRIDGQGHTLLPGLIDAHGHVLGYGLSLMRTRLRGSSSEQDAVRRVIDFRRQNPGLSWIQGRGWNQVLWPDKQFPTAAALDEHFPDTPVWLRRIDGHAGWANTKAMKLAGIDAATQSPAGGEIVRDEQGKPSGVFIDNAMELITRAIPELSKQERRTLLLSSMQALAEQGLTSVHDAGVDSDTLEVYKALAKSGQMPIRIYAMVAADDDKFAQLMQAGPYRDDSGKLDIASVKISADGALGSRGAALIEDYSDLPGHRGLLLYPDAELSRTMEAAMKAGFQVNTHAIGDNANKLVLDSYQALIEQTGTRALRHRIEHAQVLRLEDIPRFARLNVIASMQATHATSDMNMAEARLGPRRIQGAYAWRKLLDDGTVIAAGSDFPIESANPFLGLHASVTRQNQYNQPRGGWYGQEAMTLKQALASFTSDAAYAAHAERNTGRLAAGMKADFILIDRDIFNTDPQLIWQTRVLQTWIDGKMVYKR